MGNNTKAPGRNWYCDVVVIGSGIAGLLTALNLPQRYSVAILTKEQLEEGSTRYAQGGIAFAIGDKDSVDLHLRDTQIAGVGFCDEAACRMMISQGRDGLGTLEKLGTRFDSAKGGVSLHREGGHSVARVAHHGDSTGEEISRALSREALDRDNITIIEGAFLADLMVEEGVCTGVAFLLDGERHTLSAAATVIASGGAGQLFSVTTNPSVVTGDGIAAAWRAGALIADIEFIQFHPTALYEAQNPRFLISEAVRGEGAHILNQAGERIMLGKHELAELAPRDVVVRAMALYMIESGDEHLYLDVRHLDQDKLHKGFPMITGELAERGYDTSVDLIPISFAAHYTIGGVATDTYGRTSLEGLYACGEAACTGVHGANRLASNSLLEGLVFSRRIADHIAGTSHEAAEAHLPNPRPYQAGEVNKELAAIRNRLAETTFRYGGVFRSAKRLMLLDAHLRDFEKELTRFSPSRQKLEVENLLTIAELLRRAAMVRTESRGTHQRQEFAQTDDFWHHHHVTFENERMRISPSLTAGMEPNDD